MGDAPVRPTGGSVAVRKILLNVIIAAVAAAWTLASCQRPIDVDSKTIYSRQAIDLMAEGQRYEKAGNYRLALDRYNRALGLSPRPALYYHVGSCYYALGEYAKAHQFLTAAVRMAGDYPAAQYLLSKVRIQLALAARKAATPAPGVTPTPRPTEREVAMVPKPTPRPTPPPPKVVTTPTPRVKPTPTAKPTATPRRTAGQPTPTPRPTARPTPTLVNPIVAPPPPSVERIPTPRPTRRVAAATPPPTAPTALPQVRREEIFPPSKVDDLTQAPATTSATIGSSPLLGQWNFHWDRAQSFLERKLDEEAVADLLLVLGAQPRHLDARLQLADAYDRLGRGEKALEQYEKARVFFPTDPKPYFRTGNYYLRHAGEDPSHYDRARTYYFMALKVDPNYHFAYHNLGITYMKQGDHERARNNFENALKVKPDYANAHHNLGILFEQNLNNPKAALHHYREYLRLGGPDSDEVRQWVRALEESL